MTISLRLDDQLSRRLAAVAKARGVSKSQLIRHCLSDFLARQDEEPTPWELGKHLFGCYHSGQNDRSEGAAEIARERARAKRAKTRGR